MIDSTSSRTDTRSKIVDVAARLLQENGPAAVTTRGVAEAAGVQAPTIYRLFDDKDGLLEAVAEHVMATFVAAKAEIVEAASAADIDPLDDLRAGWETQIDFGVANPALFRLLGDPTRVRQSPAARTGKAVLEARVHRLAVSGRLRVAEPRAVDLIQSAGTGVIQTLLSTVPEERDPGLAAAMFEAVLGQILVVGPERAENAVTAAAVAFRAVTPQVEQLSPSERTLLTEWIDRILDRAHDRRGSGTSGT